MEDFMGRRGTRIRFAACALVGALAAASILSGCEKTQARKAIVLNPTTRQTAAQVAVATTPSLTTQPAATQAAKKVSHMTINGVWVEFPVAKLIVRKEGDKLSALLCSNDPPEVINPDYQGNRYSFEMTLDAVDDIKNIAEAEFRYKGTSAQSEDTPNGIFLDGDRQHLEPYDIQVVFDKDGDHLIAHIQGQFLYFAKGNAVGQMIPVIAHLVAKPEVK
jgi:hypothetical protein